MAKYIACVCAVGAGITWWTRPAAGRFPGRAIVIFLFVLLVFTIPVLTLFYAIYTHPH